MKSPELATRTLIPADVDISADAQAREWLCALLRGDAAGAIAPNVAARLFAVADVEGIVGLVAGPLDAVAESSGIPASERQRFAAEARRLAAQGLSRDAACRRVLALLRDTGLPVLVLKGAALTHWVYPSGMSRECGDIDLLLPDRGAVERAISALAALDYAADVRVVAGDLVGFELIARPLPSGAPGWELDLHWRLSNTPLFAHAFDFDMLAAGARPISALGEGARGLGTVHALCHACIHRAVNLQFGEAGQLKWLYDVHLLAGVMDGAEWSELARVGADRGLAGVCLHGLRSSARHFGTPLPAAIVQALAEAARGEPLDAGRLQDWTYTQWATLRALPTWRLRLRWLRQRLVPDPEFLRQTDRAANGSLPRLLVRRLRNGIARLRGKH